MSFTRNEDRTHYWAKVFTEQKSSGLNVTEYCEVTEIKKSQFYYWQRKLNPIESNSNKDDAESCFIELPVTPQESGENDFISIEIGSFSINYYHRTNRDLFKRVVSLLLEIQQSRGS